MNGDSDVGRESSHIGINLWQGDDLSTKAISLIELGNYVKSRVYMNRCARHTRREPSDKQTPDGVGRQLGGRGTPTSSAHVHTATFSMFKFNSQLPGAYSASSGSPRPGAIAPNKDPGSR